jgi:hypothetical protein
MRLKMKPRYLLIAVFVVAIPVAFLVLNTVNSGSSEDGPTVVLPSGTANGHVVSVSGSGETTTRLTATPEAAESLMVPEQSGRMLLQSHCAQCHSVKLLEQTRKSRANWEKTLSRMEMYSGLVSDAERLSVLEYLAGPDKP